MLPGLSSPRVAFQSLTRQPVTTIRPNLPSFPPRRLTFPCYQGHAGPMEKLGVSRRNQSALGVRAMKYCRLLLIGLVMASGTTAAHAGIFSKHAKADPAERVPTLIATLRAEQDERKRTAAAEELRQYDPAMFPEIIPTLADTAQRDPKSGVRLEAIQSLAKLRPISQRAGSTLEQATHDESVR